MQIIALSPENIAISTDLTIRAVRRCFPDQVRLQDQALKCLMRQGVQYSFILYFSIICFITGFSNGVRIPALRRETGREA